MMERSRRLEIAAVALGLICFALLMILMVMHSSAQKDDEIIARCDYLIARSEASIGRWDHGRH